MAGADVSIRSIKNLGWSVITSALPYAALPAAGLAVSEYQIAKADIKFIIKVLKEIKWELLPRPLIDMVKTQIAVDKITQPGLTQVLKELLRNELNIPADQGGIKGSTLAGRLFKHYLDDNGQLYKLTVDEMKSMTHFRGIDIRDMNFWNRRNPNFDTACQNAQLFGAPWDYSGSLSWVCKNGAIGNYVVNYAGTITAGGGRFKWEGKVNFKDRFDLDPIWGWTAKKNGGRNDLGERQTRIGYMLALGTDFDIKSPDVSTWQYSDENHLSGGPWAKAQDE
jgi:hypothetical protein